MYFQKWKFSTGTWAALPETHIWPCWAARCNSTPEEASCQQYSYWKQSPYSHETFVASCPSRSSCLLKAKHDLESSEVDGMTKDELEAECARSTRVRCAGLVFQAGDGTYSTRRRHVQERSPNSGTHNTRRCSSKVSTAPCHEYKHSEYQFSKYKSGRKTRSSLARSARGWLDSAR